MSYRPYTAQSAEMPVLPYTDTADFEYGDVRYMFMPLYVQSLSKTLYVQVAQLSQRPCYRVG